ncbi:MAG: S8 family serine peptidase, partial [Clostridiales bacterium]|nr:S8 family serine peptidase [Clostridiales bacterium]
MKKTIVLFLAAVLVLGFASYTLIGADTVSNERLIGDLEYAPNQVIVGLKDEASALKSQLKSLTANPALCPSGLFNEVNVVAVKDLTAFPQAQWLSTSAQAGTGEVMVLTLMLDNNQSLSDTIVLLEQNPNVEYAHPNYQFSHTVIPNDPLTEYLPPMLRIEADKAWDIETGSKDVTVGIIDTGLDFLHEDLQDNADMILAYNVVEDNQNVMDYVGHGSHIGGIIGAKGDNEIGIAGVCWDISLVPVKVNFDDIEGDAWTSDIIAGIYYAEEVQLDVINVSYDIWAWGAFQELEDAVNNFSGLVVGAAGNYGDDLDDWYPYFTCDNLILVGSSSLKDKRNEWSCFGAETVHLFAPGDEIYSTLPDNQYGFMSGTSMAAPMVAGVAALLKSREPMLTTQEIKDRILDNVDVKPKLADICISGGRLNAFKVLEPPIELPIYIMEVEVYAESLVGFDVIIDNYSRNGFIDAVLENAGDIITLIPHIFELVNGNYVIADNEIASITFYLDDIQYHPPGLALGEFELEALWSATLLTIE